MTNEGEQHVQKSGCSTGMKIVGVGCLVIMFAVGLTGYYVWKNARGFFANKVRDQIVEGLQKSGLPPEQKKTLIAEIDQVNEEFKSGKLTLEQLSHIGVAIAQGPVIPLGVLSVMGKQFIAPSGLDDAEKKQGLLSITRFQRGVVEEKIAQATMAIVYGAMMEPVPNSSKNQRLKQSMTDEEVRALLKQIKDYADAAKIPNVPYTMDFAAEIKKAIQKARDGKVDPNEKPMFPMTTPRKEE